MYSNVSNEEFLLFFGALHPFSNWNQEHSFRIKHMVFDCGEQGMMFWKSMFFGDKITAAKIMKPSHPSKYKDLGRDVKPYDETAWEAERDKMMFKVCLERARQIPEVDAMLIASEGREIVEASQFDRIWGVGLAEYDERILNRCNWRGANRLGKAWMRVREVRKNERGQ
jgi:hypothetical protein